MGVVHIYGDCALGDAKEHAVEVDPDYICEDCDSSDAKELQSSAWGAWDRGDHCIVSDGDANAEDQCYDHSTQLEHCDEELEDQVEEDSTVDRVSGDSKEHEVEVDSDLICEECAVSDAREHEMEYDVDSYDADVEDCAFGDAKEYEMEYHNAEVGDCPFNNTEEYDVDSYDADEEDCYYL